jgi:hypothetical protein
VLVWPECWPTFCLFEQLRTQWTEGHIGLRYEAVYPLLDRRTTSPREWDEWFADLRLLEAAALEQIHAPRS